MKPFFSVQAAMLPYILLVWKVEFLAEKLSHGQCKGHMV